MSSVASNAVLIGLDWGTSSLRAFLMGADGDVLDVVSCPQGIMHVEGRDFDTVFHDVVAPWLEQRPLPVIASGMITSRNGWLETPYLVTPAGIADLAKTLQPLTSSRGVAVQLVTGMKTEHGRAPDVMRGEETQIIGAAAMGFAQGMYVMPGTHSKWVVVGDGGIETFKTYLTGEIFSVIKAHTILGTLMSDGEFSKEGFRLGVEEGLSTGSDLLHNLFHVRTMPLFGRLGEDMSADYLSGMLIGAEIESAMKAIDGDIVTIVSRGDLADRYRLALDLAGIKSRRAPDNIVARGHFEIANAAGLIS